MEKKINRILLLAIVAILVLPLFQYQSKVFTVEKLHGSYKKAAQSEFSIKNWFSGEFQSKYDTYYNQNFGFRNKLVRLHNQIKFSLYGKPSAKHLVIGKENYLYEKHYITSYYGGDFLGKDSIYSKVSKINEIYKELQNHQTELLVVIAPGKGFFYPEYIPDNLVQTTNTTNYEVYIKALKEKGIPYIDFNHLFLQMKDTSSIVLYPKTGIHWSQGIIPFVADSILRKTEALINKDLAKVVWDRLPLTDTVDKQDSDIERAMNLLFSIDKPKMNYNRVSFDHSNKPYKPKLIAIADSFWWQIFNLGISKRVFDQGKFWYYYKQVYPDNLKKPLMVKDINPKKEVFQSDIVILVCTETNLYKFPFGFENILDEKPIIDPIFQEEVKKMITYIKGDEKWLEGIRKKAETRNISLDSMLYLDAAYMVKKRN